MLQFRLREGSDRRWFNPNRDMVNIYTLLISKTLEGFGDYADEANCSREQINKFATELGTLVASTVKNPVMLEEAQAKLQDLTKSNPEAFAKIAPVFFEVMFGMWAAWLIDARPKTIGDEALPVFGLDQVALLLAKGARASNVKTT